MAIVHRATLTPSKMELLKQWLPSQPWFRGNALTDLARVGSFRFDDPDGEVGIETLLVASESAVFQVPLTYRGSPLQGADLIGTMEHSFLGTRWIYDAASDPVYASALATTILTGQPQADQSFEVDGGFQLIPESVHLHSTGTPGTGVPVIDSVVPNTVGHVTTISAGDLELSIKRSLNRVERSLEQRILAATWDEQNTPVQLAAAARI
ncbi:CG0192-related protein [Pseudarthrobacter enclensis]|uniref:Maltokinase N-terminal cap domain-containing protein n=1 Tax=Pseudarthrobacter enclensis TaxID=993070 RepID=A0ABT9RWC4_9MICC|nr:hypothetical protein [Pseudarthrobacter enclensis]MDP9888614.1 hypothetical protein [Pseudarthrobacter enclensis]